MPNHVTSFVQITGTQADKAAFLSRHIVDEQFEFNTITPMPDGMRDLNPHMGLVERAKAALGLCKFDHGLIGPLELSNVTRTIQDKIKPEDIDTLITMICCYRDHGHMYWYDWALENWGTKWGAYNLRDMQETETGIEFRVDTAWSFPTGIFDKLAAEHPNLVFDITCYDEGSNFAGHGQFNGKGDFELCDATDDLYLKTYGHAPEKHDEDA